MKYPVNYIKITNSYSNSHRGIDLGWHESIGPNQPVYSCDEGVVISIEKQTRGGNVIYIRHPNNMVSAYGHLQDRSIKVKLNDQVKKSQHIANAGNSGVVTGPHLHFSLYKPNTNYYQVNNALDPLDYLYVDDNQVIDLDTKDKDKIKYRELEYQEGIYRCLANMKLRTGPGINYQEVKVNKTTKKAKSALVSKVNTHNAVFKKNTKFTALKIIYNKDSVWAQTPNGYICIKDNEYIYCEKV